MGVGVTVVLLDADVCLADSTGAVVCNDHGEEEEDEERGETESYMVSTGSEKETFFFGVTVGVGAVFFMILGDEGVETVYVLPIEKEEERKRREEKRARLSRTPPRSSPFQDDACLISAIAARKP